MYRVLETDPTQDDIQALLGDFKAHLDARGLEVRGITTDGSNLDPAPLAAVFPDVPHNVANNLANSLLNLETTIPKARLRDRPGRGRQPG